MALVPANAAAAIRAAYQDVASIGAEGLPTGTPAIGDFPADFAAAYNAYASAGVVPGAANSGGDVSILEAVLSSGGNITPGIFAQAFADFWATVAIDPGTPAHGGTAVVSVVNNAAALAGTFQSAITASMTSTEQTPWYQHFIANVESMAVSAIVWTITELVGSPPSPANFPEGIQ